MKNPPLKFNYTNYKGNKKERTVIPMEIFYGHTEYHKDDQWLLKAWDQDKKEERTFAIKDITDFK